jgi:glycerol uptake facilitator-like aquaporin
MNQTLLKQCVAEFVETFAVVFIGVGVIANHSNLKNNAESGHCSEGQWRALCTGDT